MLGTVELPLTIIAWGYIGVFIFGAIKGVLNFWLESKEEVKKEIEEKNARKRVKEFYKKVLGE